MDQEKFVLTEVYVNLYLYEQKASKFVKLWFLNFNEK